MTLARSEPTAASPSERSTCRPILASAARQATRRLFVGIGSPHGDDQVGWMVAEGLLRDATSSVDTVVRRASVPLDLIDWFDTIDSLHVCDACQGDAPAGTLHRWEYKPATPTVADRQPAVTEQPPFASLHSTGSHDFGVIAVLELAERLGRLPSRVVIWCIEGRHFEIGQTLSPEIVANLPAITSAIARALERE